MCSCANVLEIQVWKAVHYLKGNIKDWTVSEISLCFWFNCWLDAGVSDSAPFPRLRSDSPAASWGRRCDGRTSSGPSWSCRPWTSAGVFLPQCEAVKTDQPAVSEEDVHYSVVWRRKTTFLRNNLLLLSGDKQCALCLYYVVLLCFSCFMNITDVPDYESHLHRTQNKIIYNIMLIYIWVFKLRWDRVQTYSLNIVFIPTKTTILHLLK